MPSHEADLLASFEGARDAAGAATTGGAASLDTMTAQIEEARAAVAASPGGAGGPGGNAEIRLPQLAASALEIHDSMIERAHIAAGGEGGRGGAGGSGGGTTHHTYHTNFRSEFHGIRSHDELEELFDKKLAPKVRQAMRRGKINKP